MSLLANTLRHATSKTPNAVPRTAVHRFYHGVIYFQIAVRFHGTRVNAILFTRIEDYGISYVDFHESHKGQPK
jgi:hypothetical protein